MPAEGGVRHGLHAEQRSSRGAPDRRTEGSDGWDREGTAAMSGLAVRVENLSKCYRLGQRQGYLTLRDTLTDAVKGTRRLWKLLAPSPERASLTHIWALREVSFQVEHGEVVGIIGRNGAGKSTLLKILCRITEPTHGEVDLYGRVGSLLEVGTGFHPELTGRENIYLNGAILGMRNAEIARKFDEIVAFAEVEGLLDTPMKHYSSGMQMRLAFAVAAHLEPDIFLVDEALAVGDVAFQKKCLGKMEDVAKTGRTVLFVSHNMAAIEHLCHRAYLFDKGHLVGAGKTHDVVEAYLAAVQAAGGQGVSQRTDRQGNGQLRFTDIAFCGSSGTPLEVVQSGQDLEIVVGYGTDAYPLQNVVQSIGIFTLSGQCMLLLNNQIAGSEFRSVPPHGRFACRVERFPLAPGQYYLNLYCEVNGILADWVQQAAPLVVEAGDFFGSGRLPPRGHGGFLVAQSWRVVGSEESESRGTIR